MTSSRIYREIERTFDRSGLSAERTFNFCVRSTSLRQRERDRERELSSLKNIDRSLLYLFQSIYLITSRPSPCHFFPICIKWTTSQQLRWDERETGITRAVAFDMSGRPSPSLYCSVYRLHYVNSHVGYAWKASLQKSQFSSLSNFHPRHKKQQRLQK